MFFTTKQFSHTNLLKGPKLYISLAELQSDYG
jgi:hypothetical protein